MLIKNIFLNLKFLKKIKIMIWGIHYFITKLKTKNSCHPKEVSSFFQCRHRLYTSESDVYRRQILTSKVDPRAVRVNPCGTNLPFLMDNMLMSRILLYDTEGQLK